MTIQKVSCALHVGKSRLHAPKHMRTPTGPGTLTHIHPGAHTQAHTHARTHARTHPRARAHAVKYIKLIAFPLQII